MDMDERWLNRSPHVMVETFHGFQGEQFDCITDDLLGLPTTRPVLAEGFTLVPRLVAPLLSDPGHAVWLVPTPEFSRAACESRGSTWDIPRKTSDPERALAYLRRRNQMFAEEVRRQATGLGLPLIDVYLGMSEDDLAKRVATVLGLPA